MDQNAWATHCIETSLAKLTLSTKCIKQSASFLLTMPEHADLIAKLWLRSFRSAVEPASQLALLYVLNEIILKCASYGTPEIKNSFKDPIIDAMKVLRPGLLMRKVKKLLLMWSERGLFDQQFNKQILQITDKHSDHKASNMEIDGPAGIKDFSPDKLVNQLQGFKQMDETIKTFSESDLIPSCFHLPVETILYRIKSKEEGQSFSQQVSTCAGQLQDALNNMARKLSAQETLSENIDKAILFYSAQEKEAGVVVNAYKSYEQQVRSTLQTILVGDCNGTDQSPVAFEMTIEEDNAKSITASSQQNISNQSTCFEDHDGAGGGGVSDMSEDEEDEDNRTPLVIRSQDANTTRDVRELLVDPKSLAHFPFSDEIIIDDQGDVDYRPMFSKMLSCKCFNKKERTSEESSGGISCANKDVKGADGAVESVNISGEDIEVGVKKSSMADAFSLTETGDFDYRQPTLAPGETERDQQNSAPGDPFGLGNPVPKNQDADLRLLMPLVSESSHSVVDADYRQFCVPSNLQLPSSAVSSFPWLNKGDSDLRQSQTARAVVAASALANAVAVQSLLLASTPALPSQPLFTPIMATPAASMLPQHQPFSTSVTTPISLLRHQQNQSNATVSASSVSVFQKNKQPPLLFPVSDLQQAYQPETTSSASDHVSLSGISSDLISTLKKINLPTVSSIPARSTTQTAISSNLISVSNQGSRRGDGSTSKCGVTGPQDEDPFTIISRLTGLSNLIQSVKPTLVCTPSQSISEVTSSPPHPEKSSLLEVQTPNYSDNLSEEEVGNGVAKAISPASSPRPPSPTLGAVVSGEDLEQSEDGGATPTQDESGTPSDGTNCFSFPQTGLVPNVLTQAKFPPLVSPKSMHPPPLPGTSTNLLLPFPLGMPPFNPMAVGPSQPVQPPWQTALPTNCPNFGGKPLPPQAFFPVFPPVVTQSPFPNLPTSQSSMLSPSGHLRNHSLPNQSPNGRNALGRE
ncbi:regulation of nuclear pre mRNA domain containing protein [Echinococcus multilocularis]|uniref:Regulation of nuclear pre mRNA domain containing protein n=1 Tax=Echinococcus multilocularis TaxID=6211 RepID=A0A068YGU9_ECHMU|nr:regulation of nuclear pre mRNA domain containing protein [Echinococcus multilocularis]